MLTVRRILWLLAACLTAAVVYTTWQRRTTAPAAAATPQWPPFDVPVAPSTIEEAGGEPVAIDAPAAWVPAVLGACPDGFPVKVKQSSGIYHVPGGRSYERTVPDRCYADPAAAEADGYRAAKS